MQNGLMGRLWGASLVGLITLAATISIGISGNGLGSIHEADRLQVAGEPFVEPTWRTLDEFGELLVGKLVVQGLVEGAAADLDDDAARAKQIAEEDAFPGAAEDLLGVARAVEGDDLDARCRPLRGMPGDGPQRGMGVFQLDEQLPRTRLGSVGGEHEMVAAEFAPARGGPHRRPVRTGAGERGKDGYPAHPPIVAQGLPGAQRPGPGKASPFAFRTKSGPPLAGLCRME